MTRPPGPKDVEMALALRLTAVAPYLHDGSPVEGEAAPARHAGALLDLLVRAVRSDPRPERVWLLSTAVSGAFPAAEDILEGVRVFKVASVIEATLWLLDIGAPRVGAAAAGLEVVTDRVVVDVDHSARHDLHTGIQQVVRRTLPIWTRDHPVVMVAWSDPTECFRALSPGEHDRALRLVGGSQPDLTPPGLPRLLVPWHTVVVLVETPPRDACERLAGLAQLSGNAVVAIGYDCIPIVSADLVPLYEPGRFAQYLTVIKHARRVAAISSSASVEFRGFVDALPAQGILGPAVVECALPAESVTVTDDSIAPVTSDPDRESPLVLSVGSLEPRKNHLSLLYAAERLWREGLRFRVLFLGKGGWGDEIPDRVAELQAQGRAVATRSGVNDQEVVAAYRTARFTVFASLHEGYGLPVAESLALGTPVITSDYGSTKEIGAGGGALLIDPRDDEQLVAAMRELLTDDRLLLRLRTEAASRPVRTWEQYAAELWDALVAPVVEVMSDRSPA